MKDEKVEGVAPAEPTETKEAEKMYAGETVGVYVPTMATSFEDVEAYRRAEQMRRGMSEAVDTFQSLVSNIFWNEEVPDKAQAIRRLTDELDDVLKQLAADGTQKAKGIVGFFKDLLQPKEERKLGEGFTVWKEGDRYRWFAIYSNRYLDNDNPQEILAAEAHKTFIKAVDDGVLPHPELWHYHVPGTRWGVSDWLAYDEATGFSMASGFVDTGHEKEAEALAALPDVAVSHGMTEVDYDEKEKHVIRRYVTAEISDLPAQAAANKLTGFQVLEKGASKMIPEAKKDYLRKVGITDEQIAAIEADAQDKAAKAAASGLAFKESEVPAPPVEPEVEAEVEAEPEAEAEAPITREEVKEAILAAVAPLAEGLANLTTIVTKEVKSDEQRIALKAADTPAASIAALVLKDLRVVGKPEARVDGRTKGAKDGPAETSAAEAVTGIPWIDEMLAQ